MNNKKNNPLFSVVRFTLWASIILTIAMITILFYVIFAPCIHDKFLTSKSGAIICKLKTYQQVYQKLPDGLTQIMNGDGWWDELSYENSNNHDFILSISNGFDVTATYHSVDNKWYGLDHPFIPKHEPVMVDCPPTNE